MAAKNLIPSDPRFHNLTGLRFGKLAVLAYAGRHTYGHLWRCVCDCGATKTVSGHLMSDGKTKSCGCLRAAGSRLRHGHNRVGKRTSEYRSWLAMRSRCTRKKDTHYAEYGGRGIKVCKRWRSFDSFLADMGLKPNPKHTIERIAHSGHYSPSNCRWANRQEQSENKSNNRKLTFRGETMSVTAWERRLGYRRSTIQGRLARGWSVESALTTPGAYRNQTFSRHSPHPC